MLLLPKKIGSYTLLRKLGTGGVAESYVGSNDANGGRAVVLRRILPYVQRDPARLASVEGRVKDLLGVRHPFLVHVLETFVDGEDHYLVEEYIDGVNLEKVLSWCRQNQRQIPHNVFLNIATQVCNGLEALHGRTGKGTSAEHVLHLALKPNALFITRDGKVMVGGYGLTRSPTTLPHGGVAGPVPSRMEYLSPEQTHPDQKLAPASDIFALGAVLYELLTLDSLFRADSNLQTIHRVRRAEVTSQLLRVKELMPGLDKVLYRALSLNPRHRYQRAFVLREDLRGLMAGYSFATIAEDTRAFLAPLLESMAPSSSVADAPDAPPDADSFAESPITHVDLDPIATAAAAAEAQAARQARNLAKALPQAAQSASRTLEAVGPEDAGEHTENTSPRGIEDPPTEVRQEPAAAAGDDLDRPTLPGVDEPMSEGTIPAAYTPPDPTVSQPDLHRPPPPPPVKLAPLPSAPPVAAPPPLPAPAPLPPPSLAAVDGSPAPDSTAAYLAHVAPADPAAPPALTDTAAYLKATPQPPAPPPPAPEPTAVPGFSRPMPGPTLSRAMPPPGGGKPRSASTTLSPDPAHAPPPPAAPRSPPTLTPPSLPPAPSPVAAEVMPSDTAPPPRVAPAPIAPPSPSVLDDVEPPPPSRGGWIVMAGGVVALLALAVCGGGAWFAYSQLTGPGESAVAEAPAAPAPATPTAAPSDAAAVMADDAPPRLEPVDDGEDAAAALAAATPPTPTAPAPPEIAPATPAPASPAPAPTPAPAPVERTASTERATPSPAPSAPAPAPAPTRTVASSDSRATSGASATPREPVSRSSSTASAAPVATHSEPTPSSRSASPSPTRAAEPVAAAPTRTSTASAAPARVEPTRPSGTTSRTAAPPAATFEPAVDVSVEETPVSDLDQYVDAAKKGKLASTDIAVLEEVDVQAPTYTRSRALLLMNAQRKGDDKATRTYLDQLMLLPENQYNPVYLTDYARWHVNHGEYDKALEKASLAERYWARIPPELVFSKKAEIYEIQAASYQGKFYKSDEDTELLANAIKGWERYRQHVATKSRTDLQKRADAELARLQDIREKLQ